MDNLAMEVAELSAQVSQLQEEVSNATSIRHEETATNEEAVKDVQDAQSNLTQAIQILTEFCTKDGEGNDLTQQNQFPRCTPRGPRFTTEIWWEVPMSSVSSR